MPKIFLNDISIASPCSADWNSMRGNDQVRFCEHCNLNVHDLSAMSRMRAERLVSRSNGRLCVRFISDSAGLLMSQPAQKRKLHQIGPRVSRIAAGAFTAALSVTSAVAQNANRTLDLSSTPTAPVSRWDTGTIVFGTITDPNGAVIPGATVHVSNPELGIDYFVNSDGEGNFRVDQLKPAYYRIRIEAPGFAASEDQSIYVGTTVTRHDRSLKVGTISEEVDVLSGDSETGTVISGGMAVVSAANPFIKAAQQDDLDQLASLISGEDVNLRDTTTNTTALEYAVRSANREMVQFLVSHGADVNSRNASGITPLMMIDEDATCELIWDLINAGANVNAKDESKDTALMRAANVGNLEAVKALLEAGAKVDSINENGETALMFAAEEGKVNVVRTLVLAGADINIRDAKEETALDKAVSGGRPVVIRFLKAKGAFESVARVTTEEE